MAYLSRQGLRDAGLALTETEQPSLVLEGSVLVTGQVDRTNDFETGWPAHHAERDGVMTPDPLICDDQAIVVNLRGKGLVVISGCGHAGIVNMVTYARALTGVDEVHGGRWAASTSGRPPSTIGSGRSWTAAGLRAGGDRAGPLHGLPAAYAVYQRRPEAFVQNTVGTRITLKAE